jgi:cytoskeletal protein RodZ
MVNTESIGQTLKRHRTQKRMSLAEVSRVTRIPVPSLEALEADAFEQLPGEIFVRGFLQSYARAVGAGSSEMVARFSATRRAPFTTPPVPVTTSVQFSGGGRGRRFGVAMAFVLLLILFTLAVSIVLKPRGHDIPSELSWGRPRSFPGPALVAAPASDGADMAGAEVLSAASVTCSNLFPV